MPTTSYHYDQISLIVVILSAVASARAGLSTINDGLLTHASHDLHNWIEARCGAVHSRDDEIGVWVYEGALFDPLEGRRIANVQGLELVRCVASVGPSSNPENKAKFQQQCGDLEVGPLVSHPNATFDHVATILSRKLFCYQSPDDPTKLLQSIRLRPNAPLRHIPTRQAIAAYDTATTFVARGKELIAHSEWPDRQSIWGLATRNFQTDVTNNSTSNIRQDGHSSSTTTNNNNPRPFDFTVYARQKSAKKRPEQLFDLTQPPTNPYGTNATATQTASPRRAKLIEFGTSSSSGKDKFGARETYSYTLPSIMPEPAPNTGNQQWLLGMAGHYYNKKNHPTNENHNKVFLSCQLRYSRYGEGPPFFGPGRICSLELQGRRVAGLDDLPPLLKTCLQSNTPPQFVPSFFRRKTSSGQDNGNVVAWFRNQAIVVPPAEGEPAEFWLPDYVRQQGSNLWHRIRRTSSSSSSPSN